LFFPLFAKHYWLHQAELHGVSIFPVPKVADIGAGHGTLDVDEEPAVDVLEDVAFP
jgi:hypothetical protein